MRINTKQAYTLAALMPGTVDLIPSGPSVRAIPDDDDSIRSNIRSMLISPSGNACLIFRDGTTKIVTRDEIREQTRGAILERGYAGCLTH